MSIHIANGGISTVGNATAARQDIGNASLSSIDTKLTNPLAVSAAALPLPSGASTGSKQDTMISNLQAINSLVPSTYDYIGLTYSGSDLTGVIFKTGGSGGAAVSTLALTYSSGILQTVTRT